MAARAYKRGGDPVAPQRATGPCRPRGGRQAPPFFFLQGPHCEFEEKKIILWACRPMGATGGIFEILQNGHIFLKFLFFLI